MVKACIEAAAPDVHERVFGETVRYVKKSAEMIHQAVNDKASRFPCFGQYFIDSEVVKSGVTAALEYVD